MQELFELSAKMVNQKNRPFKRYLLGCEPFRSPLTILLGQRGVGKTTLIVQYLMERFKDTFSEAFIYVPMDHFILGARSMYEIAKEFEALGGKVICFDEIHKYPEWSKELKSINDSFPRLQIIASGSSALAIRKGSHDLSRRAVVQHLRSMSFREWLCVRNVLDFLPLTLSQIIHEHRPLSTSISEALRQKETTVLREFENYLKTGYYPYSLEHEATPDLFPLTLEQSVHTTIENDLPTLAPSLTGASVCKIKQLLSTICGLVPYKPDMAGLKKTLKIGDERTLKIYLMHLENAGIIRTLHRKGKSLNTLDKPEKLYLDNPNLMQALTGTSPDIGSIRETFFLSCFEKNEVTFPEKGDFQIGASVFEVGGPGKGTRQLAGVPHAYLSLDRIEIGSGNKIPLWLFGFLY
jgi:predicted AAA+ superfamily ATPase